jgi:rhamnosyltransferase
MDASMGPAMSGLQAPLIPAAVDRVAVVVVTYNPDISQLDAMMQALMGDCEHFILVDNASANTPLDALQDKSTKVVKILLADNEGIGHAQNHGIRRALALGASHVLLLDQDSLPSVKMVSALLDFEQGLLRQNLPVAAVAPQLIESKTQQKIQLITFRAGLKHRVVTDVATPTIQCFSLVASGMLIRACVLEDVGLMNGDLFIEYVDVEWCCRALAQSLLCYVTGSVTMIHDLGDEKVRVSKRLSIPMHQPIRHYYTMRNAIYMLRQKDVPTYWKCNDFVRTLVGFAMFSVFGKPRGQQIRYMCLGLWHGLQGVNGKLKQQK